MPCSSGSFWHLRFAFTVLLAAVAVAPLRCQPAPDKPSGQDLLENSIDRWNRMSPEERERELAKLPPARARLIRQRIRRYNQMNPDEQQALRERYQTFSQLPPAKQQIIRERLREFRLLPVARLPIVHGEVEQLRLLPEVQRQAFLNSEEFRTKYSPKEQQIIRDLSTFLPN
jgi:hypothetical protein